MIRETGQLQRLNSRFEGTSPSDILKWVLDVYDDKAALSTGFGASGIVLMHQLSLIHPGTSVFYLDTDLLFDETYELMDKIRDRMDIQLVRVRPDYTLQQQEEAYGEKLWETRPDTCCYIRKVLPLKRYLSDKEAWITAIRRDQSPTRQDTPVFSHDENLGVLKVCPIAGWTEDEVWAYIRINDLPFNELHDKGYPSIGCRPCTRPVRQGDDLRAGRWADSDKTECGLHSRNAHPGQSR